MSAAAATRAAEGRDLRIEAWLEDNGVHDYTLRPRMPLSQIDRHSSLHNQARYRALDEERVILVAEAMERAPKEVPPLVVYKLPHKATHRVIDGNHRREGADLLGLNHWPTYVIKQHLSDTQLRILTFTANLKHGMPTSLEERLAQAMWLIDDQGASQAEAANIMQLPLAKVQAKVQLARATKRLESLGLGRYFDRIGIGTRSRLDAVRSDGVLQAATEVIASSKMRATEASAFIARLNSLRSEQAQLAAVEEERERRRTEIQATASGKVSLPRSVTKLQNTLASVLRIDLAELHEAPIDNAMKQRLRVRAAEAMQRLAALQEVL